MKKYYASECYGNFGVFTYEGYQVGGWWPSLEIAKRVAELLHKETSK